MKIHKKLLRVIHPNRYFIWAIAYLIIFAMAMLAYIYISSIDLANQSTFPAGQSKRLYADKKLGFSVRYPSTWNLDRDARGNIVFENPDNSQEAITVSVADPDLEIVIRHSIDIRQETDFQKGDYHVAIIKADSAKERALMDLAIITTAKKLFYLSGHSSQFTRFVNNFKPL